MVKPSVWLGVLAALLLAGCQRPPPSNRPAVTLSVYAQGDAERGKALYQDECGSCHKLQVGYNEKGPQLLRVYGAKSALLTDYQYSDALKNSHQVWTAEALDRYIANPKQAIPNTRMRSEPIDNVRDRQDIIAYLSTLR